MLGFSALVDNNVDNVDNFMYIALQIMQNNK